MRPFDSVVLNVDLPERHLATGASGTVVENYSSTDEVVMVEFFDKEGNTIDVVDVRVDQMTVTLLDFVDGETVALLENIAPHRLARGQVGIVRRRITVGTYEVEFIVPHNGNSETVVVEAHRLMLSLWQVSDAKRTA